MSISAYVGLPGAGKSYGVVANVILPALKQGRRVVTNIPLNRDAVRKIVKGGEIVELDVEVVATDPPKIDEYCTAGSVVVIDEVWRLWPAGVKSNQVPESFRSLLAEHRHKVDSRGNAMNIVLVTQDLQQISAWARSLIETTFVHSQLGHVGANKKYRVASYRGPVGTMDAPDSRRIREMFGTYRKAVYDLYDSHTMREGSGSGANESAIDKRSNFWRRPIVWGGLLFVVAAPAWAVSAIHGLFFAEDPAVAARFASEASEPRPTASPAPLAQAQREQAPPPRPSVAEAAPRRRAPNYRIAGVVRGVEDERAGYVVIEGEGRFVTLPWSSCWAAGDGLTRCSLDGWTVTEFGTE